MRKSYRVSAPETLQHATRQALAACYKSTDPALRKCGAFFQGIMSGRATISSAVLEILELTENRHDELARAANTLANIWFDVAIGSKFDLPSLQQRLHPANDLLTAAAQTKLVTAAANG